MFRGNIYFQGSRSLVPLLLLNPEMLTIRFFETSGTVHSALQRHITEDLNHNKHRCDNLIPRICVRVILVKRVDDREWQHRICWA